MDTKKVRRLQMIFQLYYRGTDHSFLPEHMERVLFTVGISSSF